MMFYFHPQYIEYVTPATHHPTLWSPSLIKMVDFCWSNPIESLCSNTKKRPLCSGRRRLRETWQVDAIHLEDRWRIFLQVRRGFVFITNEHVLIKKMLCQSSKTDGVRSIFCIVSPNGYLIKHHLSVKMEIQQSKIFQNLIDSKRI